MGRLTKDDGDTRQIGRDGLLRFIDEMNEMRARKGIPQRYVAVAGGDGKLTMRETMLAQPRLAKPTVREGSSQRLSQALPSAYD